MFDFHEIDHWMDTDPELRINPCLYVCMHELRPASPSASRQAWPGPSHEKRPELRARGSPGSTTSLFGLAVTVTTSGPRMVGIQALTEMVRQARGETHHHIGTFTTPRCDGGAVPTMGTGSIPHESAAVWVARVDSLICGIQWYVTVSEADGRSARHVRAYSR